MRRSGLSVIGLFGSYARESEKETSDIDIVVEMDERHILRSFFALKQYLKDRLGKNVDIGTESAIKPIARERIMKEIIYA